MDKIIETQDRIKQLWVELKAAKPNTREFNGLLKKIRALSAKY
jgi:hypothetical protein